MSNSNIPKEFEKWAYWFWEQLPERTLRIHLWCHTHVIVWQTPPWPWPHSLATLWKTLHCAGLDTRMVQKKHNEEEQRWYVSEWNKSISVHRPCCHPVTYHILAWTEAHVIQMAEDFIKSSWTTLFVPGFWQKWVTYVPIQASTYGKKIKIKI